MDNIKEIGKKEVFNAIEELYRKYQLPILSITDDEWNIFFDVMSKAFENKDSINDYLVAINIVLRRALNFAIVCDSKEFTIKYLIDALCDLTVFHIYRDEINKIQDEIKNKLNKQKIKTKKSVK